MCDFQGDFEIVLIDSIYNYIALKVLDNINFIYSDPCHSKQG